MLYSSFQSKKGFTLMELLVVVAIIGLLAAIIMTSVVLPRRKARDARGESDIRQIMTAFQLKYSDDGKYPILKSGCSTQTPCKIKDIDSDKKNLLQPYLDTIPEGNGWSDYQWYGDDQHFCLLFKYETKEGYYTCSDRDCRVSNTATCEW